MNDCTFIGNLTRDPELRNTPNGDSIVSFSLGVNKKYKGRDGEQREQVVFPNFDLWGTGAVNFVKLCRKGSLIVAKGEYTQNKTEKDGEAKVWHSFRVNTWQILNGFKDKEEKDEDVFENEKPARRSIPKPKNAPQPEETDEDIPF